MTAATDIRGGLAIFVKTPGHSTVKSRLAADCGDAYALDWYRHAAAAVASIARAAQARSGLAVYWAVAEADAHDAWCDFPTLAQRGGDLGTRMAHVHAQLVARHGFSLLIGADAPQITTALLHDAATWLAAPSKRLVLGRARDGGFWLFGANVVAPLAAWTGVSYSQADTARDFRAALADLGEWRELESLTDVDRAGDLAIVQHALQTLPDPTAEQSALATWMRDRETVDRKSVV